MITNLLNRIAELFGLDQFKLQQIFRISNSENPADYSPATQPQPPERDVCAQMGSSLLGIAELTGKYPGIEAFADGKKNLWEIIKKAHEEGVIPDEDFNRLAAKHKELTPESSHISSPTH